MTLSKIESMREYQVNDEIDTCDVVTASSAAEALKIAKNEIDPDNYAWNGLSTFRVNVEVCSLDADGYPDGDDNAVGTVTFEAREPKCSGGAEHTWETESEISHFGGMLYEERCTRCAVTRALDTSGSDGDVVTYENPSEVEVA